MRAATEKSATAAAQAPETRSWEGREAERKHRWDDVLSCSDGMLQNKYPGTNCLTVVSLTIIVNFVDRETIFGLENFHIWLNRAENGR